MTSLNGEDGGSSSQKNWVGDEASSTEVSCNTEVLNNTRVNSHDGNIGQDGVEVELTAGERYSTLVNDGLL